MPFGSGGPASLSFVEQVTLNTIRVRFSGSVSTKNRGAVFDALYDRGYTLSAFNDAEADVPRVIWAAREDAQTVILSLDAPLTPFVVYELTVSSAITGGGVFGGDSAMFATVGVATQPATQITRSFDLANEPAGEFGPDNPVPLGTLIRDTDGDYKNDAGLANLRKRVIRRITTRRGAFAHLPDYGMNLPIKSLFRPSVLRTLQADALEQVLAERGVISATVVMSVPRAGILRFGIRVVGDTGSFGVDVSVPLPVV